MGSPRSNAQEPTDKAADAGRKSTETARTARPMSHKPSRAGGEPTGKPNLDLSRGMWIGASERVKLVLQERVEPGQRGLPDAHTL